MLEFEVKNQKLTRLDVVEPATDSEQYLKAKFTVKDSDWNGKTKTALFRLGEAVYKALLDSNNMCIVPSEVLVHSESKYARTQGSKIFVSLIGEDGTVRITTDEVQVDLNASGYSDALTPAKPTESEYQQILTQYANNEAAINEAKAECETARADLVGVKNIFANAIKGNISGSVVFADDVSPVEHNPIVKVHGKNVFNPDFLTGTKSLDALSTWGNIIVDKSATTKMLKPNTTYTMSFTVECVEEVEYATFQFAGIGMILYNNGEEVNIGRFWSDDENDWLSLGEKMNFTKTFTTPANMDGWVIMGYTQRALDNNGNAVTNVLKFTSLQIEEGETATKFEPYVDPLTMKVKRCGKNLLTLPYYHGTGSTMNGIAYTVNSDGSIHAKGTATAASWFTLSDVPFETIIPNFWNTTARQDCSYNSGNGITSIFIESGLTVDRTYYPMIQMGTELIGFEKGVELAEFTPNADGTVEGITSLSPNMTILTDTEGAIVECEYIKDTNKVLQKIAEALNITI